MRTSPSFTAVAVPFLAILLVGHTRAQFLQTGAGPWNYNDPANWAAANVNGNFSQTPTAAQTVTFPENTTLATGLVFGLGGTTPALTLRSSGGNSTATLGGSVSVLGSNTSSITIGSATDGQKLNLDLGGSDRTFAIESGNTLSVHNVISGGNSLLKAGAGVLTLAGANTFSGSVTINGGTLASSTTNAIPLSSPVSVNGTAAGTTTRFNLNTGITQTIGALTFGGAGATSTSTNTVGIGTGATLILGGTVTYDATNHPLGATITGTTLALGATRTFNIGDSSSTGTELNIGAAISGNGLGLVKTGAGTLSLSGANTFDGGVVVNQGSLAVNTNNSLATSTNVTVNGTTAGTTASFNLNTGYTQTIGALTFGGAGATSTSTNTVGIGTGATLILGGTVTYDATNHPLAGQISGGTLALGATRTFAVGNSTSTGFDLTVSSSISGTGLGLVKTGSGVLNLTGANTYDGGSTINEGTLRVGANNALVTTAPVVVNATTANRALFTIGTGISQTIGTLTFGGPGASNIGNLGNEFPDVSILAGGTLTLGGTVKYDATFDPGRAHINGPGILALGGNRTFDIDASPTSTSSRLFVAANITGAGFSVTKTGLGQLAFNGANTYSGGTFVTEGSLNVSNMTGSGVGSGSLIVSAGAKLRGSGFIGGATTIQSGAILDPGNQVGTFTFTNGLTIGSGTTILYDLGTTSDLIAVTGGTLTGPASGVITVNLLDSGGFAPGTYTLFSFTSGATSNFDLASFALGTLVNGTQPGDYVFGLSATTLTLTYTTSAIPEPSTYAAVSGLAVLGLTAWRRRRIGRRSSGLGG